jgi:hypothetical protein
LVELMKCDGKRSVPCISLVEFKFYSINYTDD